MALSFARKAAIATAAVAALGGISFGASASEAASGPAARPASAPAPVSVVAKRSASAHQKVPQVVRQVIGKGRVDGHRWSVALEFHRTLPKGYTLPTYPDGTTAPGTSLLCQRMYIGGVRIDHQGGPWADCQPVTGTQDPQASGGLGLWGLHDKGLSGSRLMVSNPEANVAYGIVSLSDGTQVKAATVTVPGTAYRAWAAPVPNGRTITSVDQYDAHDQRLSHDTGWR
ncbi:hypothetical protein [Streptomyces sp. Caat 7-52]|uniref:hypothetical protein n=1 Tax=Streptomyces sp. Caat 7-52 TaxID=2949637 RepID=UPI002035CD81|nr:hypothetical protein [Streptomyces sp. Caat 7-52]